LTVFNEYLAKYQLKGKNGLLKIEGLKILYKNGIFQLFGTVHSKRDNGWFSTNRIEKNCFMRINPQEDLHMVAV